MRIPHSIAISQSCFSFLVFFRSPFFNVLNVNRNVNIFIVLTHTYTHLNLNVYMCVHIKMVAYIYELTHNTHEEN